MKAPRTVFKSHCNELEFFQRKLCLKDNGANTEEILFLLQHIERTRTDMLSAKDLDVGFTSFYSLWQNPAVYSLMKKIRFNKVKRL